MSAIFLFTYSLCFDYIDLAPIVLVLNVHSDVSLSMLAFLKIFLIAEDLLNANLDELPLMIL